MTVPFSEVVTINPNVLSAGGNALDLNCLMLTTSSYAPLGTVLQFADAASVATQFGSSSTEYSAASVYFAGPTNSSKKPGALLFARFPSVAIAATVTGGSQASTTLATIKALTGTLAITVNGTLYTSSSINLSSATSFSNAATIITAAFTTPPFAVTYDSTVSAFIVTTTATGSSATVTYATTGTMATGLKLTAATGAVLSQGSAAVSYTAFLDSVVAVNQNWATFMTLTEPSLSLKEEIATWSATYQPRYLYIAWDTDSTALTANSTATFGNYLQANSTIGTCAVYGTVNYAAFVAGWVASLNFTKQNARSTLCFQQQSTLSAYVTSLSDYTAVLSNGYNVYAAFGSNNPANNQNWMSPGSVSGKWLWADTYVNQIWLSANLQLALVNLLTSAGSIPYNKAGYSLIYSAALGPINAALNFGAIRAGVTLSASQITAIQNALGFDASPTIQAQGFYLQVSDASAATRAARTSPPVNLYYQDGGSVQQITMASIAIQ